MGCMRIVRDMSEDAIDRDSDGIAAKQKQKRAMQASTILDPTQAIDWLSSNKVAEALRL